MGSGKGKFFIGSVIILAAVIGLVVISMSANAEYFVTVDELRSQGSETVGRKIRLSGAVVGSTIQYDPQTLQLFFEIAHVPGDQAEVNALGGLAAVLHAAVLDPARQRILVVYQGARPDLLQDETQAIVTGELGVDGIFYADELLLKCPTKYEDAVPSQAVN